MSNHQQTSWRPLIIALVAVLLIWIGFHFIMNYYYSDFEDAGQVGDKFGALNTLFSGCAFVAFIYALILQRNELGLQREELELTRKELAKTAEAQQETVRLTREAQEFQKLSSRPLLSTSYYPFYDEKKITISLHNRGPGTAVIKKFEIKSTYKRLVNPKSAREFSKFIREYLDEDLKGYGQDFSSTVSIIKRENTMAPGAEIMLLEIGFNAKIHRSTFRRIDKNIHDEIDFLIEYESLSHDSFKLSRFYD